VKVLVVYAHVNPDSYNHAILEAFTKGLSSWEGLDLVLFAIGILILLNAYALMNNARKSHRWDAGHHYSCIYGF
jgi:hypothetical protein